MNRFLPMIALLALTGCATSETTYLNNGEQGLTIDCSGEANSWATCYEKADASCAGTGYNIYVRMQDGRETVAMQDDLGNIRVGSYVRVVNGRAYSQ